MTKSANINIPVSKETQQQRERSLSDSFNALSLESKEMVMAMAGGARPSSTVTVLPGTPPSKRHRIDSIDMSPVTLSLLNFHGLRKPKDTK
jgi:hypothetical protein